MSKQLKLKFRDANGLTYGDPSDSTFTVRFKRNQSSKTLDGNQVINQVSEIIWNCAPLVEVGDDTSRDYMSIRVRVSGADVSLAKRKALLAQVAKDLAVYATDDTIAGFDPTIAPTNPF